VIDVRITPDDGESYKLAITSRVIMAWERANKGVSFQQFMDTMNFTHLYDLSHRAALRARLFSGTLQEFEETVDIDILKDVVDDEERPTHAGA
jgi:hypothetical protein